MTIETTLTTTKEHTTPSLGKRLQSARETLGLEHKEIAAQLRLSEKFLGMIEQDVYPSHIPLLYMRGYIRAYGNLLNIPENELKEALEAPPLQHQASFHSPSYSPHSSPITSNHHFMRFLTFLILLTLFGLVGAWWYSLSYSHHPSSPEAPLTPIATPVMNILQTSVTQVPETVPANIRAKKDPLPKKVDLPPLDPYNTETTLPNSTE